MVASRLLFYRNTEIGIATKMYVNRKIEKVTQTFHLYDQIRIEIVITIPQANMIRLAWNKIYRASYY